MLSNHYAEKCYLPLYGAIEGMRHFSINTVPLVVRINIRPDDNTPIELRISFK